MDDGHVLSVLKDVDVETRNDHDDTSVGQTRKSLHIDGHSMPSNTKIAAKKMRSLVMCLLTTAAAALVAVHCDGIAHAFGVPMTQHQVHVRFGGLGLRGGSSDDDDDQHSNSDGDMYISACIAMLYFEMYEFALSLCESMLH